MSVHGKLRCPAVQLTPVVCLPRRPQRVKFGHRIRPVASAAEMFGGARALTETPQPGR
jgi:hypothetical protein